MAQDVGTEGANLVTLGRVLKAARIRLGFSQGKLLKKLDYSATTYAKLERGELKRGPAPAVLGELSHHLKLPLSDIYRAGGWLQSDPTHEAQLLELWSQIPEQERDNTLWLIKKIAGVIPEAASQ